MTPNFLTDGDRRAEADRIAKARGPAYAEGYQAGLMRAIELLQANRRECDPRYDTVRIEEIDVAIDSIGNEVEV